MKNNITIKWFAILHLVTFFGIANAKEKNVIEITIQDKVGVKPETQINYFLLESVKTEPSLAEITRQKASTRIVIPEDNPVGFYLRVGNFIAEPGDSIVLAYLGDSLYATGEGATKFNLILDINTKIAAISKPSNPQDYTCKSENDFLEWHDFTNKKIGIINEVMSSYKDRISSFAFQRIKATLIDQSLDDYSDKFGNIFWGYKAIGLTKETAFALYDTKYKVLTDKYLPQISNVLCGTWKPVWWAVDRQYNLDYTNERYNTGTKRLLAVLEHGKKVFKGRAREEFIFKVLYNELIHDEGFKTEVEAALSAYYAESDYPEYKANMRKKVQERRERLNARIAPEFSLTNVNGTILTKANLKGKLAILDFWFTGCIGCLGMVEPMKRVEETFKNDTNVVFINVSIDTDKAKWLKSLQQKKYTSGGGISLYTNGEGSRHSLIREYGIDSYPSMIFLDPYGRTINIFPKFDARTRNGDKLIEFIKEQLKLMNDGPYVLDEEDGKVVYSFSGSKMIRRDFPISRTLTAQTDIYGKKFTIKLKDKIEIANSEHVRPDKLLVFSDIEGNFEALKRLLQNNKVIDSNLNWSYANGHLVFAGDMFDRGNQVTECLWLLYSLELEAKVAGGSVHFVLGNHEIMNLQGNNSYVQPKYKSNAEMIGKSLKDIYGETSELGRWLRSKNIIEKVGDLLFVHGGIGVEFNEQVKLDLGNINNEARKHYANEKASTNGDSNVRAIFHGILGPFWFRHYYEDGDKEYIITHDSLKTSLIVHHPSQVQLQSILNRWKVNHIITGHTIIADTISTLYNNKVINTDVPHAKGKSEALLIEGNSFYRVNDKGQRFFLFKDPEEDPKTKIK